MNKLLQIAIGEIGKGEYGANNCGLDVEKYLDGRVEPPANWCMAFISWCLREAGADVAYHLSARAAFNDFRKRGWKIEIPQPGDLVFWPRPPVSWQGHVGIVEQINWELLNIEYHTIEGNKGIFPSKVLRYKYELEQNPIILGFIRIPGMEQP